MTPTSKVAIAAAVAAWIAVGRSAWLVALAVGVAWMVRSRLSVPAWGLVMVAFVAGGLAGLLDDQPPQPLVAGSIRLEGTVRLELASGWGWRALVATEQGMVLVRSDRRPEAVWMEIQGVSDGTVRRVAGRWIRSSIDARSVGALASPGVHRRIAEEIRHRIIEGVRPQENQGRALLLGFLVGDTRHVSEVAVDEMRRTGLSHLVAVSGSNVALFLAGLALIFAPLAIHPAGRTFLILNGVLVFGALTRWEPSVLRASAMAAVVAVGRFVGIPLEPATALAAVAGGAVIVEPSLVDSVGFQLSVAASAGLLLGAGFLAGRGPIQTLLAATISAQLAVAPVLLAVFGAVPLLSPIANLVAIPIVAAATVVGGAGAILGLQPLVGLAGGLGQIVLGVARAAAPWPQLGWIGFAFVVAAGLVVWRLRPLRPLAAIAAAASLVVLLWPPAGLPQRGMVVFDIGQGDSILVEVSGFTMLVDGGPEPARLAARLDRYGVESIDLVVASHVHADHVSGLVTVLERIPVGAIWAAFEPHDTPASQKLVDTALAKGIPIEYPRVGDRVTIGDDTISVIGPVRRYHGPNDQSIVLLLEIGGVRTLLAGDIETVAQGELAIEGVDVLKVPHQGAATSTPSWLERHAGAVSIISVGPNEFGHPADWVVSTLAEAGARVLRTDEEGDVVVEFVDGVVEVRSVG